MAKREKLFYFQQKQINASLLVLGVCIIIFLLVWLVILPLNFSKRPDVKRVIRTTLTYSQYKITAILPVKESKISEIVKGSVSRPNEMSLNFFRGYGLKSVIINRQTEIKISGKEISGVGGLDKLWENNIAEKNIVVKENTDKEIIDASKRLFDPLVYLTNGVKAKNIGKTTINGKLNNWFRVSKLKDGQVSKINNALSSLTSGHFGYQNFSSYDIYFDSNSNLVNRVIINYVDYGKTGQVKLEFSDYAK